MDSVQGEGMRLVRGGRGFFVHFQLFCSVSCTVCWNRMLQQGRGVEIYVSFSRVSLLLLAEEQMAAEEGAAGGKTLLGKTLRQLLFPAPPPPPG